MLIKLRVGEQPSTLGSFTHPLHLAQQPPWPSLIIPSSQSASFSENSCIVSGPVNMFFQIRGFYHQPTAFYLAPTHLSFLSLFLNVICSLPNNPVWFIWLSAHCTDSIELSIGHWVSCVKTCYLFDCLA